MILIRLMKSSILTASRNVQYEAKCDVNKDSMPARRAMSKNLRPIQLIPAAFVLILQFFTFSAGQDIDFKVTVKPDSVEIKGIFTREPPYAISFLDEYGDEKRLIERLSEVDLTFAGKDGPIRQRKRLRAGEIIPSPNILAISYTASLKYLQSAFAAAHTSWLTENAGLLMLDDLLPQMKGKSAKVSVEVPGGWKIVTSETELSPGVFAVQNLEKGVFYLGRDLRTVRTRFATIAISGNEWLFRDSEAAQMTAAIVGDYTKLFGSLKSDNAIVRITEFPSKQMKGAWEADTRGRNVTIVSSDMPFKSQSLQRLHEQLRHEIFHLWIPNGVNLTGNYDWFYEGFALYQSLKMGVGVNRIRFDDYLDTLSRAYASDARRTANTSMIESSRNRWNGSSTDVYARGILVAFLCDLAMLDGSKGKRSTDDLLRELYSKHSGNAASQDGNAAILALLKRRPELVQIADRYITGAEKLDLTQWIGAAGIEMQTADRSAKLSVGAKPTGRQKDLLDKLGYNNWRRLANGK